MAERPAPMIPMPRCRIRPAAQARLTQLVARMGLPICDVIRLVVDAGIAVIERELPNNGGQQS